MNPPHPDTENFPEVRPTGDAVALGAGSSPALRAHLSLAVEGYPTAEVSAAGQDTYTTSAG